MDKTKYNAEGNADSLKSGHKVMQQANNIHIMITNKYEPVCVIEMRDNSLTSDHPAHLPIRIWAYLCCYCRMGESKPSDPAGAYALLSVVAEDDRRGFSRI